MEQVVAGIVDDHPALSSGVRRALEALPEVARCVEQPTVSALLDGEPVDVVVLDLDLGDGRAPEDNVAALVERNLPVLLYTQERRPPVLARCLHAGALGVVDKQDPLDTLTEAFRTVLSGQPFLNADFATGLEALVAGGPALTARELDVLRLYAAGLPLKSVARRVGIAQETAKEYLVRIRRKYVKAGRPANTKSELYQRAVEDGHLRPPLAQ